MTLASSTLNLSGQLPPSARHVLVSVNPRAGARSGQELVADLIARLQQQDLVVEATSDLETLTRRTGELQEAGELRVVVAAGGDGTAGLLANRLPAGTPLTVLPLGTENLLAKSLGIGSSAEQVAEVIRRGTTLRLDAGRADDRVFLLMASCGFDADVVRRLHSERKGHIRHSTYVKPIFESLRKYRYPELRVYCDPELGAPPLKVRWVFVVNLPRYAIGLRFVPEASAQDGRLDLCTFRRGTMWFGLRYFLGVLTRRHRLDVDCRVQQARRIRIEADEEVPYQLDGDPGGTLPLDIEILPGFLRLVAPENLPAT